MGIIERIIKATRREPYLAVAPNEKPYDIDFAITGALYVFVVFIALLGIVLFPQFPKYGSILMLAFASFVSGMFVGFLFGIPKVLQANASELGKRNQDQRAGRLNEITYQQHVNTNLTEISDWVTKIIVGLSLINLKEIPKGLSEAGTLFAKGFPDEASAKPFGISLIVGGAGAGFLFGYLTTRLVLAHKLARADVSALQVKEASESNSAQIDSLRGEIGFLKTKLAPTAAASGIPSDDVKEMLATLADEYTTINHPDWTQRVKLKDEAADRIANFLQENHISRDWLVDEITRRPSDGYIAGLATLINSYPEKGDLARILKVSELARWKHTRYRIVLAIANIFKTGWASADDRAQVLSLLDKYYVDADGSLRRLIIQVRSLISQVTDSFSVP
jgi:hypothetical protein